MCNTSDLGTRGIAPATIDQFWMKGPEWLGNVEEWPEKVEVKETAEAQTEALPRKEAAPLQKQGDKLGPKNFVRSASIGSF